MEELIITATAETPTVILNSNEGIFKFTGKSYPENVNDFYTQIISYLQEYIQSPNEKTLLEFNWQYYNTATSKMIVKIITTLKTVHSNNKSFEVNWICKSNDDLMIEKGEELKEILDITFTIIIV